MPYFLDLQRSALNGYEKRDPPEPDILCEMAERGKVAFELVEVIDQDLAQGLYGKLRLETIIRDRYRGLEPHEKDIIKEHVGNALMNIRFLPALSFRQRVMAIPQIFAEMKSIDPTFEGDYVPPPGSPLGTLVKQIMVSRGDFRGPIWDIESVTWFGDPSLDRIKEKFGKHYQADSPIELLVYFDLQPDLGFTEPHDEVKEYITNNISSSPFKRVWMMDLHGSRVMYRYP